MKLSKLLSILILLILITGCTSQEDAFTRGLDDGYSLPENYKTSFGFTIELSDILREHVTATEEANMLIFHMKNTDKIGGMIGAIAEVNEASDYTKHFPLVFAFEGKIYGFLPPKEVTSQEAHDSSKLLESTLKDAGFRPVSK